MDRSYLKVKQASYKFTDSLGCWVFSFMIFSKSLEFNRTLLEIEEEV